MKATANKGRDSGATAEGARIDDAAPAGSVLILGNLQVGKTTLFRKLCGAKTQHVNLPESSLTLTVGCLKRGRTAPDDRGEVDRRRTRADVPTILDSPGTATLFAQSEDEAIARDALLRLAPRAVLVVADAKNMRRSLALVAHVAELGVPMVVAVNMEDEGLRHGTEVDTTRLSELLGVDVVPTVAVENRGTSDVLRALRRPRVPRRLATFPEYVSEAIARIEPPLEGLGPSPRGAALLLLAGDRGARRLVRARLGEEALAKTRPAVDEARRLGGLPLEVVLTDVLYETARELADQVVARRPRRRSFLDRLGLWAQHPVSGLLIAFVVIGLMYEWVGVLGATIVVDALNVHLFEAILLPGAEALVAPLPWPLARDAIMDPDFGLVPTGLFLAFGIVLPVLFFFYLYFEVLQSSGYLARLSVLLDQLFRRIGLNGKAVLPLVMGFSCVTMALLTTRMLDTRKERIIASLVLVLALPCAPLLAVMLVVLADLPVAASITVFGVIGAQALLAGYLTSKVVPGRASDFVMILPDMRLPAANDVLLLAARRTYYFMREAVPFFLVASLVLFAADRVGALDLLERASRPVVRGALGLPDDTVRVFIKTMIRRENGAAELNLLRQSFDNLQLVVTLVVMTLLVPCVNTTLVLFKERGLRDASLILVAVSGYALAVGALVSHLCRLLGVSFD